MINETIESIRIDLTEKISSPIIGSFAASWALWNYKFFVILFSENTVKVTFDLIEKISFPTASTILCKGLLFPALTASAYIFAYPYVEKIVYTYRRKKQNEINQALQEIENETLLSVQESRNLRSEMDKLKEKHSAILDKKDSEITRLTNDNSELSNQFDLNNTSSKTSKPTTTLALTSTQKLIINIIAAHYNQSGKSVSEAIIVASSESDRNSIEYDLKNLESMELVSVSYHGTGNSYRLTQKGREILLSGKSA